MQDRFAEAGAQPAKPSHYAPIFVAASLTGLYTQRSVFHDPSNVVTQRFYGGRPDTLFNGLNVELSNELTLIRRFGTVQASANYAQPPLNAFQWELDDGTILLNVDTQSFVYKEPLNLGAATQIFAKSPFAGRGYFVASGDTLYYGDGIDLIKYTPTNPNGLIWNWGIAAPTSAPTVTVGAAGSSAAQWAANTVFSTMGLLVDPNNNVQQLSSVNANPTAPNATQIGTSGPGTPNFNTAYLATTNDGSVTWTSLGQITLWEPNTTYQPGNAIYDPGTNCIFITSHGHPVKSGTTRPAFNATLGLSGARVSEPTGARWENIGQANVAPGAPQTWASNTHFNLYNVPASGADPTNAFSAVVFPLIPFVNSQGQLCGGQPTYLLGASVAGTTANTTYTPWNGIPSQTIGQITDDNQLAWICQGSKVWIPDNPYTQWVYGNTTFSVIEDQNSNMQVCISSGTSGALEPGSTATLTAASNASGGNTTYTGTFPTPFPVGFPATITGFVNAGNNATGQVVSCNSTTLVIVNPNGVAETHSGVATFDPWSTVYGGQTTDGTATWVCVGPPVAWTANTKWFLPAPGFAPPLLTQAFGGSEVVGSAFVQAVIVSGISGGSTPTWSVTVGATTTDNAITWETVAAFSNRSITWTKSHVYAYSFACRTPTDPYDTTALLTFGNLNTPQMLTPLGNVPGLTTPLGFYSGGGTGAVSTASPVFTLATPNITGAVNQIGALGSTDPQVDTIIIWRDADGGGPSNMFDLIHIPAPKPIAGVAQPWTFFDFLPDIASTVGGINYPGLDNLAPAPIDHQNDPPPAGFLPLCDELHFSRIWGAVGNTVFHSSGPDNLVGNPNEAFNPNDDDFPFKSTVVACIHTPAGLICPTTTDQECIYGGPSTASFYSQTMIKQVGLLNYNAWDRVGGEIYFVSTDCQVWSFNPTVQLARAGFPIGNLLAAQLPANGENVSLVAYENGTDNAVFVGDGATGWYRLNPHQVGADMSGENAICWSPFAQINGGAQLLKSVLKPMQGGATTGPVTTVNSFGSQGTVSSFVLNCVAGARGIAVGDVGILVVHSSDHNFATPSVASVTDSLGNTWATGNTIGVNLGHDIIFTNFGANEQTVSLCTAPMLTAIPPGGAFTITVTMQPGGGFIPTTLEAAFISMTGISFISGNEAAWLKGQPDNVLPPNTTFNSNTTIPTANAVYLAIALPFAAGGITNIPTGYTPLAGMNFTMQAAWFVNTTGAPANDTWTQASSSDWGAFQIGYTIGTPGPGPGPAAPTRELIIGSNMPGHPILARSQKVFTDNGTPYDSWFEIGAITMVYPGQRAAVKFLEFDFMPTAPSGVAPLVYYALDDPSPTPAWVQLATAIFDPPVVYGSTITPPYLPNRYNLNQNAAVAVGRRIRLKVDFGSNANNGRDELISFAIFGKKYHEG